MSPHVGIKVETPRSVGSRDIPIPKPAGGAGDIGKRLYCEAEVRWNSLRHGVPGYALMAGWGGMGDDLLYTAISRALFERTGRPVWMLSRHRRLFENNESVSVTLLPRPFTVRAVQKLGATLAHPGYGGSRDRERPAALRHHIALMATELGLTGPITIAPQLNLTEEESTQGRIDSSQIAIQSSALSSRYPIPNKQWPVERMAEVARRLARDHTVVQLGSVRDPLLPDVVDRRGLKNLRLAAAIIRNASCLVCLEGFLSHLSRAVGKRAVVVYGGYTAPDESGYPCNENLFTPLPCSPCWEPKRCDFERKCLTAIQPEDVLSAVTRVLNRGDAPLETSRVELPASVSNSANDQT